MFLFDSALSHTNAVCFSLIQSVQPWLMHISEDAYEPSYLRETRQVIGSYTLFPVLTCGETRSHPRRAPRAWRSEFFVGNQANTFYR